MKNPDPGWQFWFAIIGAIATAITMFFNLRLEVIETKSEVHEVKFQVEKLNETVKLLTPRPASAAMIGMGDMK